MTNLRASIARYSYMKYKKLRNRKDFYSRIKQLNAADCLDSSSKPSLNVIILVIDCLRGSQLSWRAYPRETTPFLDAFDSKFRAISASCWTHPAVASLLTGLYPHNHNAIIGGKIKNFAHLENFYTVRKPIVTLPEILFLSGYRAYFGTAITVASYPFKGRGIPEIHERSASADELMTDLTSWISTKSSPFFAYLHLGDLHEPLKPPHNFRNFFGKVKDLPRIDRWNFGRPEMQQGAQFQEYRENRILLYDNTLRYLDHAIEKFYATLKGIGLVDSTILIITADHGEEFWEHARLEAENFYDPRGCCGVGHGHSVFNEIIEIPLLISAPAIPDGQSRRLTSAVDIMPTVLDLLEVKHNLKFDGQNIFGKQEPETPLLSEASGFGYEKKALIIGKFKLIYSHDDGVAWVFDLENDPEELHPITDQGVVSMFVDKLSEIQKRDRKRRIRETVGIYTGGGDIEALQYADKAIVKSGNIAKLTLRMSEVQEIPLPPESGQIRRGVDICGVIKEENERKFMEIAGWAFIEGQSAEDSKIYVVLKSEGATYVFDTETKSRPHVTEEFKELNLNLDNCGFTSTIPLRKIKDGHYIVGIYIRKGDIEALRYTDRVVVKSGGSVASALLTSKLQQITLPGESGNIQFHIDSVGDHKDGKREFVEIHGWAFIEGQSTKGSRTYVILGSDTTTYVFDTIPKYTWWVPGQFGIYDLDLDWAGFIARISKEEEIEDGTYKIGIYVKKGDIEALKYTGRVVEF